MNGYFLCADILGFSDLVKNLNQSELDEKINVWIHIVHLSAKKYGIEKYQLISDTVFAAVSNEKSELKKLINFSRELLNLGIHRSLLIRGGISYGQYTWNENLVYGPAVIKAHNLEMKQQWLGISLGIDAPLSNQECKEMQVIVYPVPHSNGPIVLSTSIIWNVPTFEKLKKLSTSGGLTVKGHGLDWQWSNKIQNTGLFGLYLNFLSKNPEAVLSKYHGLHPFDFINEFFINNKMFDE